MRCGLCGSKAVHVKCGKLDPKKLEYSCPDHGTTEEENQKSSQKAGPSTNRPSTSNRSRLSSDSDDSSVIACSPAKSNNERNSEYSVPSTPDSRMNKTGISDDSGFQVE